MYWHNEALSHPEDKAQLNIHCDLWVDPGKQFTGSGTIVHLADNNGIIPLGSFHHCHFSSPWLMFPQSSLFCFCFFFLLSLQPRARRNRSRGGLANHKRKAEGDRLIGKQTGRTGSGRGEGPRGAEPPYLKHAMSPSIIPHYHRDRKAPRIFQNEVPKKSSSVENNTLESWTIWLEVIKNLWNIPASK